MKEQLKAKEEYHHVYLGFVKKLMLINGTWPTNFKGLKKVLYTINYEVGFWFMILLALTSNFGAIEELRKNFKTGSFKLAVPTAFFLTAAKAVLFRSSEVKEIITLVAEKESRILTSDISIKTMYLSNANLVTVLLKLYSIAAGVSSLFYDFTALLTDIFVPLPTDKISGIRERRLIHVNWYPFDFRKHYYLTYALQLVGCFFTYTFLIYYDIFFICLLAFVIIRIKILQYMFKDFSKFYKIFMETHKVSEATAQRCHLKICIQEHEENIRFIKKLDSILSIPNLITFLISSFQLAAMVLVVLDEEIPLSEKIAPASYFVTFSSQLFLFYWSAHEISVLAQGIGESIFLGDWYNYTAEVRKAIPLVVMRSQHPLNISVGRLYCMDLQLLVKIYRALYSYVALFSK